MISTNEYLAGGVATGKPARLKLPVLATRQQAEDIMSGLAASVNARRKLTSEMDALLLDIKKDYENGMATLDKAIEMKAAMLQIWAEAHPEEFPKEKKSITFLAGTLGFRTGTPKVALLSRAWNWEKVLAALKSLPSLASLIRVREEVDKEQILSTAAAEPGMDWSPIGVKIVQDESFYVEPNLTTVVPIRNRE